MADKRKEPRDVLFSAATALPVLLGIVKGSQAINKAWGDAQYGSFKFTVSDIFERFLNFTAPGLAYVRPADQALVANQPTTPQQISQRLIERLVAKQQKTAQQNVMMGTNVSTGLQSFLSNQTSSYWAEQFSTPRRPPRPGDSSARLFMENVANDLYQQFGLGEDAQSVRQIIDNLSNPESSRIKSKLRYGLNLIQYVQRRDKSLLELSDEALENALLVQQLAKDTKSNLNAADLIETFSQAERRAHTTTSRLRAIQYSYQAGFDQTRTGRNVFEIGAVRTLEPLVAEGVLLGPNGNNRLIRTYSPGGAVSGTPTGRLSIDPMDMGDRINYAVDYARANYLSLNSNAFELTDAQTLLDFATAHQEVRGFTPTTGIHVGQVTTAQLKADAPALRRSLEETRREARTDPEAAKILRRMAGLHQVQTPLQTRPVNQNMPFNDVYSGTPINQAPSRRLKTQDDVVKWLQEATDNLSPEDRLRRNLQRDLYKSLGYGAYWEKLNDPTLRAKETYRRLQSIVDVIHQFKDNAGTYVNRYGNLVGDKEASINTILNALAGLEISFEGITSRNAGIPQQQLNIHIKPGGGVTETLRLPWNVMGYISPSRTGTPETATPYLPHGLEPTLDNLSGYSDELLARVDVGIRHSLIDIIQSGGGTARLQKQFKKTLQRMSFLHSPTQFSARDIASYMGVINGDAAFLTGRAPTHEYEQFLKGSKSLDLIRSGGRAFLFDTEYSHGLLDNASGPQLMMSREGRAEIYELGYVSFDLATGKITNVPNKEYIAKPHQFLGNRASPFEQRMANWVEGFNAEGAADFLERVKNSPAPEDVIEEFLRDIEADYHKQRSTSGLFPVAFGGQAQTTFDTPLMRRTLGEERVNRLSQFGQRFFQTDPGAYNYNQLDVLALYSVVTRGQVKALSQEQIFPDLYGISVDSFEEIIQERLKNPNLSPSEVAHNLSLDHTTEIKRNSMKLMKEMDRQELLTRHRHLFSRGGGVHTSTFDSVLTAFNLAAIIRNLPEKGDPFWDMIDEGTKYATEQVRRGRSHWSDVINYYHNQPELTETLARFDSLGSRVDDTVQQALRLSLVSRSKSQAAKGTGTLLPLEITLPFGMLNNMQREKYQVLAGRAMNPYYTAKNMVFGRGHIIETEAGILTRRLMSMQIAGDYRKNKDLREWLDKNTDEEAIRRATERAGGKFTAAAIYDFLDSQAPQNKIPFTGMTTVMTLLPENFNWVAESGLGVTEEFGKAITSYKGMKSYKAQFKLNLTGSFGNALKIKLSNNQVTPELVADMLKGFKFHPAVQKSMNDAVANNLITMSDKGIQIQLNTQDDAFRIIGQRGTDISTLSDEISVKAHQDILAVNPNITRINPARPPSDLDVIGNVGTRLTYDELAPGIPESMTVDMETGMLSLRFHQIPGDILTNKVTVMGGTKGAKASITVILGERSGLFVDTGLTSLIAGNKFGKNRNEIGSNVVQQMQRVLLKLALDEKDPLRRTHNARRMINKILGTDKDGLAKHVRLEMRDLNLGGVLGTEGGVIQVPVPVLPYGSEHAIGNRFSLRGMEAVLRDQGLTYGYVRKLFEQTAKQTYGPDVTAKTIASIWTKTVSEQRNVFEQIINQELQKKSTPGQVEYIRNLKRMRKHFGDPDAPALFDIVPLRTLDINHGAVALRLLGDVSITDDATEHWMKIVRGETFDHLPNTQPRAMPFFSTIYTDSLGLRFQGAETPEEFTANLGLMMGYWYSKAGLNYVNRLGGSPIKDSLKSIVTLSRFFQGEITGNTAIKNARVVSADEIKAALSDIDRSQIGNIDITGVDFVAMDDRQKARLLANIFGEEDLDPELTRQIYDTLQYESRVATTEGSKLSRHRLTQLKKTKESNFMKLKLDGTRAYLEKYLKFKGGTAQQHQAIREALVSKLGERLTIPLNVSRTVKDHIQRLAIRGQLKGRQVQELLTSLDSLGDSATVLTDEILTFRFGSVIGSTPYIAPSTGNAVFGGASAVIMSDARGVAMFHQDYTIDLNENTTKQAVALMQDEMERRKETISGRVERNHPLAIGGVFGQAMYKARASTTEMAYGKLQSVHNLLPTIQSLQADINKNRVNYYGQDIQLNKRVQKVLGGVKSISLLDSIQNLGIDSAIDFSTGVVSAKGFGINEGIISFSQAQDWVAKMVGDGEMTTEAAIDWLSGRTVRRIGFNREPAYVPAAVLTGSFAVYPDEIFARHAMSTSPYVTKASVLVDPLLMKFMRGDQDGDLAALINIGGFYDNQSPESKALLKAIDDISDKHTKFLSSWQKRQMQLDPEGPGISDIMESDYFVPQAANRDGTGSTRYLYKIKSGFLEGKGLQSNPAEVFAKPLLRNQIDTRSGTFYRDQIAYLVQKSLAGPLGAYQRSAMAIAYGPNNMWQQLGSLLSENGDIAKAFDLTMSKSNVNLMDNGVARAIKSTDVLSALNRLNSQKSGIEGYTNSHLVIGLLGELTQRGAIDKIQGNPITELMTLNKRIKTLLGTHGVDELERSLDYFIEREQKAGTPHELTLTHMLYGKQGFDKNPAIARQQRRHMRGVLSDFRTMMVVVENFSGALLDAQASATPETKKQIGELIRLFGYQEDLVSKPMDTSIAGIVGMMDQDAVLQTSIQNMLNPELQRIGVSRMSGGQLFTAMMNGSIDAMAGATNTPHRALTEELSMMTKKVFDMDHNSFLARHGGKMAAVAGLALFFSPNAGPETVGRGGEEYDTPSIDEIKRSLRNRKSVRVRDESPTLKDKLNDAFESNPTGERQEVLYGRPLPPRPHYQYNDKRRRHTPLNVAEFVRRANGIPV